MLTKHDALLFTTDPAAEAARQLVARVRVSVGVGTILCAHARPLAELIDRHAPSPRQLCA